MLAGIRRYVGKDVAVTWQGTGVESTWTSVQVDLDTMRWILRCYCHGNTEHTPLTTGKGELVIFDRGAWSSWNANLKRIGQPYTFDDAIVYEYAGALEAAKGVGDE